MYIVITPYPLSSSFYPPAPPLPQDLPDVEGDEKSDIRTAPVRLGIPLVFRACLALLTAAYLAAMAVGAGSAVLWSRVATVAAHGALLGALWHRAQRVDLRSSSSIYGFYMFIWGLFYSEYLLLPLFR